MSADSTAASPSKSCIAQTFPVTLDFVTHRLLELDPERRIRLGARHLENRSIL
jgi:hypothetical protein